MEPEDKQPSPKCPSRAQLYLKIFPVRFRRYLLGARTIDIAALHTNRSSSPDNPFFYFVKRDCSNEVNTPMLLCLFHILYARGPI